LYCGWLYGSLEDISHEDAEERDNDKTRQTCGPVMGRIYHTARSSSPNKGQVLLPQDMRIPIKGDSSGLERPKNMRSLESFERSEQSLSLLLGAEWEQVIRSEVPFELLEEVQVVFFEVFGML
jgi:hypothetical protein